MDPKSITKLKSNTNTSNTTTNNKDFIPRGHSFDNTSIFHEGLKQFKTINKKLTNACSCIHLHWTD